LRAPGSYTVKTFIPGTRTCSVGVKAQKDFGKNFFWILGGIPKPNDNNDFEYYIIPASIIAKNVNKGHQLWLSRPGVKGQQHKDNKVRTVPIPPYKSISGWSIKKYLNRWDLIENKLKTHTLDNN